MYRLAKQMRKENQDVVGEKCVRDDAGNLSFSDKDKRKAWKQHYEKLLNVEFPWPEAELPHVAPVEGPPILITAEMVSDSIRKMKQSKAPGPSGIVAEMLKAAPDCCSQLIADLTNAVVFEGKIPSDWDDSFIINLYKGKGDALERGNYRGLKLTDQVLKVIERILEKCIRQIIDIDSMQFGFMPGRGTTDAIFIVRQIQEKYLAKNKNLYLAFVDLEKAFDRVPRRVLWWAMRVVGVPEWIIKVVQAMYSGAKSRVRVNDSYSDEFEVKVGVHQGSVLSPLLFIIVLEALSREFRTGCPWELLYADDLVIIAESLEELVVKLKLWKGQMESKGLRVNMGKTKIMFSGLKLNSLHDYGKYPCGVCRKGVGVNSIFCEGCTMWIHKGCSGRKGRLVEDPTFRCPRCLGTAREIDGRPCEHVLIDGHELDVVESFCYLGDSQCPGGTCEACTIHRCRVAWGRFRELLPLLTNKGLSLSHRGVVFRSCVRNAMLHASECWPLKVVDRQRLVRNERAMLHWMCHIKASEHISCSKLCARLQIPPLEVALRERRLRWFGHVQRSNGWIRKICDLNVAGAATKGRPRKTWPSTIKEDMKAWNLDTSTTTDRTKWRIGIRAAAKRQTCASHG